MSAIAIAPVSEVSIDGLLDAFLVERKANQPLVLFCPKGSETRQEQEGVRVGVHSVLSRCKKSPRFTVVFHDPMHQLGAICVTTDPDSGLRFYRQ
jgi:hypothetical protein